MEDTIEIPCETNMEDTIEIPCETNMEDTIEIPCEIIHSDMDLIVGRPAIKQYNLLTIMRNQILGVNEHPRSVQLTDDRERKTEDESRVRGTMLATLYSGEGRDICKGACSCKATGAQAFCSGPQLGMNLRSNLNVIYKKDDLLTGSGDESEFELLVQDLAELLLPEADLQESLRDNIEGTPEQKDALMALCLEFRDIFSTRVRQEAALITPMTLDVDVQAWLEDRANKAPPRLISAVRQDALRLIITQLLELDVITHSQATATTQVHLVPKPGQAAITMTAENINKLWRFCLDYRLLNSYTTAMGWPLPNIPQLLQRVGSKKPQFFAIMDLVSGYHQALMAVESQEFTAFTCFMGVSECLWDSRGRRRTSNRNWQPKSLVNYCTPLQSCTSTTCWSRERIGIFS